MKFGLLAITIIPLMGISMAFAEELSPDDYLWVPQNMLAGESYEGSVILDSATNTGQIIILSTSDPTVIKIPESVTIHSYQNHGIFPIKPLKEGESEIFAVVDGTIISSKVHVFSSSRQPEGLRVFMAANQTKTDIMLGYVLSVDSNGSPAPVKKDSIVKLSASPMIDFESDKIEIKTGQYKAKFVAKIQGSGKIYAQSENLKVGEFSISKISEEITVKVAVAPNILRAQSKGYFFVWLEKDGKPYVPPYVIHAYLSSSNLASVRFNENPAIKQYSDSILKIPLVDGVGYGNIISQGSGSSVITANVDGIGSAQTNIIVGPVLINENFEVIEPDNNDKKGQIEANNPNVAFVWFYPKITTAKAYGVVALYNMNSTQDVQTTVSTNNTLVSISSSINRVNPVPIDGRIVSLSKQAGLSFPTMLTLSESNNVVSQRGVGSTSAYLFEVTGQSQGNYTVSISGPGLERYQTDLIVSAPFHDTYSLKLTPIPFVKGEISDVAMISLVDKSGVLVDPKKIFQGQLRVTAFTTNDQKDLSISRLNSALYSTNIDEITRLTVAAGGVAPIEAKISPSGIASSVMLDVPSRIHISEPFPYVIHEVDAYDIPIRRLNSTGLSATPGILSDGNHLKIDNIGDENLAAVSKIGAASKTIETYANVFNFDVTPIGETNRVGKEFEIKLDSDVSGFEILVDSPLPFKKTDDLTYVVTPDKEGYFNITFTAVKQGYIPTKSSFTVISQKFVNLVISALGSDGSELNVGQSIQLGNGTKSIVTPFSEEVRPQFATLNFPADVVLGNKGYRLNNVAFADQQINGGSISNLYLGQNTDIVASYDRMVKVSVENAEGGGYYPYGQTITITVPPKDKVSFLIRDVFDHWEGNLAGTDHLAFAATSDIEAKAVLREDYSFLMLLVAGVISGFIYLNFKKKGLNLGYYLHQVKIVNSLKNLTSKKSPTKIDSESEDF